MAGEIVYADIKHTSSEHSSSLQRSGSLALQDIKQEGTPMKLSEISVRKDSQHHGIFLKVGCAMIIILLVIVIVLSMLVIQFKSARQTEVDNESKKKYCTEQSKSEASSSIVSFDSSTVRTSCPTKDWRPHGGKCYWVAENENKKSWNESKNDCVMKNSHLMVIRDFTDTTFLWQNVHDSFWVGLRIPPGGELWTWLDNSTFDPQLFSNERETRSKKCAWVSSNKIIRESCETNYPWICQL
ncbi:killer cell lectin-like receptor subfamily B member 1B allele A isoform 1-T1 [Dama dama]|uniref:killer cell lectin-like receptor subfamily B member 1B allele A isoform X1 n=1 Tax=Dama dama TaxID=30532 RepID=UPI002A35B1FE|nr:killer cell lectin-like receptor subfamily B member 1B allele A isoform X1 [Dama dama]